MKVICPDSNADEMFKREFEAFEPSWIMVQYLDIFAFDCTWTWNSVCCSEEFSTQYVPLSTSFVQIRGGITTVLIGYACSLSSCDVFWTNQAARYPERDRQGERKDPHVQSIFITRPVVKIFHKLNQKRNTLPCQCLPIHLHVHTIVSRGSGFGLFNVFICLFYIFIFGMTQNALKVKPCMKCFWENIDS